MERQTLVDSICQTTIDYRAGELAPPTPDHVERWVGQFHPEWQIPILTEMEHVLRRTYFSKDTVAKFMQDALNTKELAGEDPCSFWPEVQLLDIQGGGNSQREMNILFEDTLKAQCNVGFYSGDDSSNTYVYLDDGIFTGNRVRRDLENWVENHAPDHCHVHIVCIASHSGGKYYAESNINKKIKETGKDIEMTWWHRIELEDRRTYSYSSDVLRPVSIPEDRNVQNYVDTLQYTPTLRTPGSLGSQEIFSSEAGRNILEQAFLASGVHIREMCPNLGNTQRPLGHMTLESLGFGSLVVTYRNCPNNAPLALWVGDPWYPLFPRTTNTQTANKNLFSRIMADGF